MPLLTRPAQDPHAAPESPAPGWRTAGSDSPRRGLPRAPVSPTAPEPDPSGIHQIGQLARTLSMGSADEIQRFAEQMDQRILSLLDQWRSLVEQPGFQAVLGDLALIDDALQVCAGERAEHPPRRAWVNGLFELLDLVGQRLGGRPTRVQAHAAIAAAVADIDARYPALIEAFEGQSRLLDAFHQTRYALATQREATDTAIATLAARPSPVGPPSRPTAADGDPPAPDSHQLRRAWLDRRLSRLRLLDRSIGIQIHRVRDFQHTQLGLDQALRELLDHQLTTWLAGTGAAPSTSAAGGAQAASDADDLAALRAGIGALLEVGRAFTTHRAELAEHIVAQAAGLGGAGHGRPAGLAS